MPRIRNFRASVFERVEVNFTHNIANVVNYVRVQESVRVPERESLRFTLDKLVRITLFARLFTSRELRQRRNQVTEIKNYR